VSCVVSSSLFLSRLYYPKLALRPIMRSTSPDDPGHLCLEKKGPLSILALLIRDARKRPFIRVEFAHQIPSSRKNKVLNCDIGTEPPPPQKQSQRFDTRFFLMSTVCLYNRHFATTPVLLWTNASHLHLFNNETHPNTPQLYPGSV